MPLVSTHRFSNVISIPVALAQTELRRGSAIKLASVTLLAGQTMQLRFLFLNIVKVLTPGVLADEVNTGYGLAFVGVYADTDMATSHVGAVVSKQTGVTGLSPFYTYDYTTPGKYSVILWNNTGRSIDGAMDMAVSVSGALKVVTE